MTDVIATLRVLGGRYEIGELLGRGGMAEVHRGRDLRLDRPVAIKLLKSGFGGDPDFRTRFRQEAQSAARMSHPTVVRVFDAGEEPAVDAHGRHVTVPYIVMEYVDGRMVKDIIAEGPLTESEAVRITKGILTALEYSHRAGVIHRDIKPGNVMVTPGGHIKVMDFGIARAVSETSSTVAKTGAILGTAQYFSPEQARGERVDHRSDLYSTGVMLFEMLTGRPPFRGDTAVAVAYQHVSEPPVPPSTIVPGISPAMDSVVLKSLAKQKTDRFSTAAELREALDNALLGLVVDVDEEDDDATAVFTTGPQGGPATAMFQALDHEDYRPQPQARPPVAWLWGGVALIGVLVFAIVFWAVQQGPNLPLAGLSATVPSVEGLTQEEAMAAVDEAGLTPIVSNVVDDSDPGTVLRTEPVGGTSVAPDSEISIVVSNGPPPVALVDVQNLTVAQATNALNNARLEVGETTEENSPTLAEGLVIRTDPEANTPVSVGTTINLAVSTGLVSIPDVVGLNIQAAEATMESAEVGYTVRRLVLNSCMGGRVTNQSLAAGDHPQRGTISLTYCGGQPPPPPSPTPAPSEAPPADPAAPPAPPEGGEEG